MALRRASTPAEPAIRAPGRPSVPASPGTSRGEISATAMNRSSAPGARSARRPFTSMPGPNSPRPSTASASPPVMAANRGARRPMRPGGISAPSRIAETGETRVARSAGPRPASTVTTMPTASETTSVRVLNTVLVDGRSMPFGREHAADQLGEADSGGNADHRGDRSDHERLDHDGAQDLAPGGTEGPHER
jgi:hypothetical protein